VELLRTFWGFQFSEQKSQPEKIKEREGDEDGKGCANKSGS
jgi:hypothetical protein